MIKMVREGFLVIGALTGVSALLTVLNVADKETWLVLPLVFMAYLCFRAYVILGGNNVEK